MASVDANDILRPKTVVNGRMKIDKDLCTQCGLCIRNCPFVCWEKDEDDYPRLKDGYQCFSCYNCMIPCPVDAVSIVDSYHVEDGFWATEPHDLEAKLPFDPKDADGNPDQWNAMEKAILERRSVRNFKDTPVPEPLIRRVLEAGRFAPSAGNCQPWQFIVISDRELIRKVDAATMAGVKGFHATYMDDELVKTMAPMAETNPGGLDPRIARGGMGAVSRGELAASLGAPCMIVIAADVRSIGPAEMSIGICGQNMNLVANSLGIKACWAGFPAMGLGAIADKINLKPGWNVITTMVLGYPAFKQEGIVPREYRPVQWVREGSDTVEID